MRPESKPVESTATTFKPERLQARAWHLIDRLLIQLLASKAFGCWSCVVAPAVPRPHPWDVPKRLRIAQRPPARKNQQMVMLRQSGNYPRPTIGGFGLHGGLSSNSRWFTWRFRHPSYGSHGGLLAKMAEWGRALSQAQ